MIFRSDLLSGKVALITGGGTGIGLGIARQLAGCGADVAIASRKPEHLDAATQELTSLGVRAIAVPTNVRDRESVASCVQRVAEALGRIDVLINNAAGNFYAASAELSVNGWRTVMETDLYGTFFCSQAVYPVMTKQGGGRIISISMTLHYRGWPGMAHATAAKAGVDALTRTLALEWAPDGITVNAIAPGPIPTEGAQQAFASGGAGRTSLDETAQRFVPLARWGTPEDVGQLAAYLCSPAGDWITGQVFVVDGGSSLVQAPKR